ncbi:MAG: MBL fold metallo-hydrolase [Ruminococcaceae bacterium]|nr:MBL fold metallo-hydrolase [Oscillospiraceae bacterium]
MYVTLDYGLLGSNTYIYWNENDGADTANGELHEACIIDAGCDASDIAPICASKHLNIKYIILTHCHIDHICYTDELCEEFAGAVTVCHTADAEAFGSIQKNVSVLLGMPKNVKTPELKISDGDTIIVGGKTLKFINTPGHTEGGVCILAEEDNIMFTGDTLFCNGFGRTDLGGNPQKLKESITRLYEMDPVIKILPGHGESSTIGEEAAWGVPSYLG